MNIGAPFDERRRLQAAGEIVVNTRELAAAGFTPATSSNFSVRLDEAHAAITVSGREKGQLTDRDVMVVDLEGRAVGSDAQPSAETLLHTQLYRRFDKVGCVLHTHSVTQTVVSRLCAGDGHLRLANYELLKAFAGNATHAAEMRVPVLPNSQDMRELADAVEPLLDRRGLWGYLIEGHGLYVWGRHMAEARRHLEAFETLFACELELRRLGHGGRLS